MKYQTIPVPIDAVQFRKDEPWPPNVYKYPWNTGPGESCEDLPTVDDGSLLDRHRTWLRDGEWIVTYSSGLVKTYRDADFRKTFESC